MSWLLPPGRVLVLTAHKADKGMRQCTRYQPLTHNPVCCPAPWGTQLAALVPLLLRTMRAPRLGTARAAICTLRDLLTVPGLDEALCLHVADDSSPTSSAVLALMQKATGGAWCWHCSGGPYVVCGQLVPVVFLISPT